MKLLVGFLVGVAVASAVPIAHAQETGSLITHSAAQYKGRGKNDARQVMLDFGACLSSRSPGRVAKMISLPVDSAEYRQISGAVFDRADDECLSGGGADSDGVGQLSFSSGLLRGALLNATYVREFGRAGPTDFAAVADSGYAVRYAVPLSQSAISAIALEKYGECIVRADGANARALVLAAAGSGDESAAFSALAPRFGACLTKGNKIAFSKATLRSVIAEGLYWLSVANIGASGKAK